MLLLDFKYIEYLWWIDFVKGEFILMLFSVVDDCSGVVYQEYYCVYGEDVEMVFCFLFNLMVLKVDLSFFFQGWFKLIYLDNGLVVKCCVFQSVMWVLGIEWQIYIFVSKDGMCIMVCLKGKVECFFCIVKEVYEILYYFYKLEIEVQVNEWLLCYLVCIYNQQIYCVEFFLWIEDWIIYVLIEGICEMCLWDQFCCFVWEFEWCKVGFDV